MNWKPPPTLFNFTPGQLFKAELHDTWGCDNPMLDDPGDYDERLIGISSVWCGRRTWVHARAALVRRST